MSRRWKCHACESDFAQPEKWYSGSSIGHAPDGIICPYCKSDDIEQVENCSVCGKPMFDNELTYGICDPCIEDYLCDHADEFVVSDPDVYDMFALYMSKRLGGK